MRPKVCYRRLAEIRINVVNSIITVWLIMNVQRLLTPALVSLLLMAPAYAQEEAPAVDAVEEATPADDEPKGLMLDEIIVTAQKRAEDIQDVPISMSAIGGETLKQKNIETLTDLSALTPNTEIQAMPTLSFIYMRGLGSGFNIGFEQSVGMFFDGVFYGRMSYLSDGLLDIERVEVLRGPQGTLYGKNTIAGALAITTGTPTPEFAADLILAGGEFEQKKIEAMVNVPLFNDKLVLRGAFGKNLRDGYINNTKINQDEWDTDTQNWRVKAKLDATDWLDITLAASGSTVNQAGQGAQLKELPPELAAVMALFDPEVEGDITNYQSSLDRLSGIERDTLGGSLTINADIGEHTLTAITGLTGFEQDTLWDADISPIPFLTLKGPEEYEQLSQEIRLLSPANETLDYIVGLYYFENNVFNDTTINVINEDTPIQTIGGLLTPGALASLLFPALPDIGDFQGEESRKIYDQDGTSYAIYGQATWYALEDLAVIAGLRYSYEEKSINFKHMMSTAGVPGAGVVFRVLTESEEFDVNLDRSEQNVSPKISLRYEINDEITTYLTYAEGWKGGGFSASANRVEHIEFDAENSKTYEAGVKMKLAGGAISLNLGLFHTKFDNLQVSVFNGLQFIVENAAAATTQGVEFDAAALLSENIFITASGGYTYGVYDSFPNGPCQVGEDAPCDLTGNRLANAPRWNGALGLNYNLPLGNTGMVMFAGLDIVYSSKIFFDTDLDPIDAQEALTKYNGRLGIAAEDNLWAFTVHGRNLSDEVDLVVVSDVPVLEGAHFGAAELPRTITAEFRVSF